MSLRPLAVALLASLGWLVDCSPSPPPRLPAASGIASDPCAIVPRPRVCARMEGEPFLLTGAPLRGEARALETAAARRAAGAVGAPSRARPLVLSLQGEREARDPAVSFPTDLAEEAYAIDVDRNAATITASSPAGLYYGVTTLLALAGGPGVISPLHIEDAPRFRVRAVHLDVARHFFSARAIMGLLDRLADYKFNVFHWHLTDDQGFRLPIASHPELARRGGSGGGTTIGGFGVYTEPEIREIVAYARERQITVIPEIEGPGHARAILASHPELACDVRRTVRLSEIPTEAGIYDDVLCPGNDATFGLLGDVLRDVATLFPARYVHAGGDEVPLTHLRACPRCRARVRAAGLSGPEALPGYYLGRIASILASLGRQPLVWDDALDGDVPRETLIAAWQGADRGALAVSRRHDVILAPHDRTYFDAWQSNAWPPQVRAELAARGRPSEAGAPGFLPWQGVLAWDPLEGIAEAGRAHVLGGEAALWTEYAYEAADLEGMYFPRIVALAEVLWSSATADAPSREASFVSRFQRERERLDRLGVRYFVDPPTAQGSDGGVLPPRRLFLDHADVRLAAPPLYPDGAIAASTDGSEPRSGPDLPHAATIHLSASTRIRAKLVLPGGRESATIEGVYELASPAPADLLALADGVSCSYYEGAFRGVGELHSAKPIARGVVHGVGLDAARLLAPRPRDVDFGLVFEGELVAPATGIVHITATSDDGIVVEVDGRTVLSDAGVHPAREASGDAAVAAGPHAIRVAYFQGGGGKTLKLVCEGEGLPRGDCPIRRSAN